MERFIFDLKGSKFGRAAKGLKTPKTMRKDIDFITDKRENIEFLSFSPVNQSLLKVIRRDVAYLQLKGLLDYSLLLSVEESED